MYVCICNAVTDRQIRAQAREGCCTLRELSRETGCATTCGKCARHAREILAEELARLGVSESDAAHSHPAMVASPA